MPQKNSASELTVGPEPLSLLPHASNDRECPLADKLYSTGFGLGRMSIEPMLFCLILGCLISLLAIPLMLLPGLRRSLPWLERRRNAASAGADESSVPRLGGVALAAAFIGVSLLVWILYPAAWRDEGRIRLGMIWTALAMCFIGLWDDFRPLGFGRKLFIQTLIALAACLQGVHLEKAGGPLGGFFSHLGVWAGVFAVLWLLALTYLFHRLDTINGLAGGVGLVLMISLACTGIGTGAGFSALCAIGMAGALLGFLVYNLPPARICLGGGGAGLIGFLIGNFSLVHPDNETTLAAVLGLVLPLLGMCLALWLGGPRISPTGISNTKPALRRLRVPAAPSTRYRS